MGEHKHTIDAKGRLIIPSRFREELGQEFIITRGLDGCLFIFPQKEWKEFEMKLRGLPLIDKNARKFSRFFLSGAAACELDKQGRILIEVWSKERWDANNSYEDMDEIAAGMQDLGLNI